MSADTEYAGGRVRDIPAVLLALTRANPVLAQHIVPILHAARIVDTLQEKRGAGSYTGLDNTSWADRAPC
jgi:hypothetical protein